MARGTYFIEIIGSLTGERGRGKGYVLHSDDMQLNRRKGAWQGVRTS